MYVAYDGRHVIAFHDDKDVVEKYCELIEHYHNKKLTIGIIKKKKIKKIVDLDELYLVRYGETYVQAGYVEYLAMASDQINHDHQMAKEVLLRVLEISNLDEKETKSIKKTIVTLSRIINEEISFTPELSYLRNLKISYDPYLYNSGVYDR